MADSEFKATPQVGADHYRPSAYLNPHRMASFGHQLSAVMNHFPGATLLEIGGGTGIVKQLLRLEGHPVWAMDLDPALSPDVVASLPRIPLRDACVDVVLCCQVLEHVPFEVACAALKEMRRIAKKGDVISVPSVRRWIALTVFSPGRNGSRLIGLPSLGRGRIRAPQEHHWELEANVSTSAFRSAIREAGFVIEKDFRPAANMYHHFFVLRTS